jgi:hypothetical protein
MNKIHTTNLNNPNSRRISGSRILLICSFFLCLTTLSALAGKYFLVIFVILFFGIFIILRPTSPLFLFVSLGIIILFSTPFLDAMTKLRSSNQKSIESPDVFFENLFTPNSGQTKEVLDQDVLWMLAKIHEFGLKDYQLSNTLDSRDTHQSIVESAWPIRMEFSSKYHFLNVRDLVAFPHCIVLDKSEEQALVKCP